MTKDEILQKLKKHKKYFQDEFDVERIGLFGSYATGNQTNDSDIDIFVNFKEIKFRKMARLWNFLENIYGIKIDLFQANKNSDSAIYKQIKSETIFV